MSIIVATSHSGSEAPAIARSRPGQLLRVLAAARDPAGFFRRAAAAGDPFRVRLPGLGEVVFTSTAEGAREIFATPPAHFDTVRPNPIEPVVGPHSLILLSGQRHARERKLMSGPLCGQRMRALGEVIEAAAEHALAAQPRERGFSAQDLAQNLTLEVIVRAVFGVEGAKRQREFRAATARMLDAYRPHLSLVPALRRSWLGLGWRRFVRARAELDRLLIEEIAARRQRAGGRDILSLLLDLRHEDGAPMESGAILDELRTLLVAGHETTATALVWALHYVHADETIAERLRRELEGARDTMDRASLARAPYLSAVCQEALRIHPVVPILLRRLREPMLLRGVELAAGTNVGVAVTELHRDPTHFPDPERFDPERFIGRKPPAHAYVPFGGGHRRCLGAGFAAYEMKIALAVIMRDRRLSLEDARAPRPVLRGITMGPDRDLRFGYR